MDHGKDELKQHINEALREGKFEARDLCELIDTLAWASDALSVRENDRFARCTEHLMAAGERLGQASCPDH